MNQKELDALFAAVAQGVINIDSGITAIENDSRVYRGMAGVVRMWASGEIVRNPNVPDDMDPKDRRLFIAAAIELLGATRDNENEGRWKYYAEETGSYWSVTGDELAKLGEQLDGSRPGPRVYEEWAEKDETAFEMKGRRSRR